MIALISDLIDFLEPTMAIVGSRGLGKLKGWVKFRTQLTAGFFLARPHIISSKSPPFRSW
jgi:hypothetical protein